MGSVGTCKTEGPSSDSRYGLSQDAVLNEKEENCGRCDGAACISTCWGRQGMWLCVRQLQVAQLGGLPTSTRYFPHQETGKKGAPWHILKNSSMYIL